MAQNEKRKRNRYSTQEKVAALAWLNKPGENLDTVSAKLGIPRSCLSRWQAKKPKLEEALQHGKQKGKTLREGRHEELGKVLFMWCCSMREAGAPLTDALLLQAARDLASCSPCEADKGWKANNGWLTRWKEQYQISSRTVQGERRSADLRAAASGVPALNLLMIGFEDKHRYNMDETALYWRALPLRTLNDVSEEAEGFRRSKERVTLAVWSRADGGYFDFWLIGKSQRPRAFRRARENYELATRNYMSTKKAWMTGEKMVEMCVDMEARLPDQHQCVLLLDNAPVHPEDILQERLKKFKVLMLPPNTTALIQPNDQGPCVLAGFCNSNPCRYHRGSEGVLSSPLPAAYHSRA